MRVGEWRKSLTAVGGGWLVGWLVGGVGGGGGGRGERGDLPPRVKEIIGDISSTPLLRYPPLCRPFRNSYSVESSARGITS